MGNRKKNRITGVLRCVRRRFGCLLVLCAALGSAGCTKEPAEGPAPADGTVMAEVTLTPEFMQQIDVRSVPGATEDIVKDVWMLQFNSEGTALLQNPQYITSLSRSSGSYKLSTRFVLQTCRVYFIANTHNSTLFTPTNASTEAKAESVTLAVVSEASLGSADGNPMSGLWSGKPDPKFGLSGSVSLARAIAEVTLKLSAALPAGHTFRLKGIKVKKVPKVAYYFRINPTYTSHPAATKDAWFDDYVSETYNEALSTSKILWWYLPENMRGTGTATDQRDKTAATAPSGQGDYCTYIEVSGTYNANNLDDSGISLYNVTYRIFLGEDNTKDYNLKRNTHYTVTAIIKGINTVDTRINVDLELDYTDNGTPWFYVAPNDASGTMGWSAAMTKCPAGWRLPTLQELMLMWVYKDKGWGDSDHWSSTEDSSSNSLAWYLDLNSGYSYYKGKDAGTYYVRCLRDV